MHDLKVLCWNWISVIVFNTVKLGFVFVPTFPKSFVSGGLILAADYSQLELRILAHLSHDHHIVSKRKWGTQSRCPGLRCILHFRTYWPDANFCHLHGPPLSSPLPYLTYLSIHVSSILRAAVAETSTRHWSQWCNEVQWPVIILHYPDQVTYGLQLSQRDPSAWSERKKMAIYAI